MEDEDIINYCIQRLKDVPSAERGAQFRTVIVIKEPGKPPKTFDGILRGLIVEQPIEMRVPGFPFESLFFVPDWQLMLGDVHQLTGEEQAKYLTHRLKAVQKAVEYLETL